MRKVCWILAYTDEELEWIDGREETLFGIYTKFLAHGRTFEVLDVIYATEYEWSRHFLAQKNLRKLLPGEEARYEE